MRLFIWKSVANLTSNWHDGGGLVVVAQDLDEARKRLAETCSGCEALTADPDVVYALADAVEAATYVFPDAGCC